MDTRSIGSKELIDSEYELEWPTEMKSEFTVKARVKESNQVVNLCIAPVFEYRRGFEDFKNLHEGTLTDCVESLHASDITGKTVLNTCFSNVNKWIVFVQRSHWKEYQTAYAMEHVDYVAENFWGSFADVNVATVRHSGRYFYAIVF